MTLLLIPYQLQPALSFQGGEDLSWRYHRFMTKLFGIRIHIGRQVGARRGCAGRRQPHVLARHPHLLRPWAGLLRRQVGGRDLAAVLDPGQAPAHGVRRAGAAPGHRAARDEIRDRLLAGDTLVLFPEGTSSDGQPGAALQERP
ncbi:MAG: hypothetical protein WDM81_00675 [Rhizomicrobium sp.]